MGGDDPSDSALLAAWASGCLDAGNQLVERYFGVVHRFFRNKVGTGLDDLVQQTFLGCIEARGRYQERSSFKTYLLAIARNQLYNHYRRQRYDRLDFTTRSAQDLGASPNGLAAKREMEHLLLLALQRIPIDSQVLLELAYWEHLTTADIAAILDVPVNTVHSRLHRARQAMRRELVLLAPELDVVEPELTVSDLNRNRDRGGAIV